MIEADKLYYMVYLHMYPKVPVADNAKNPTLANWPSKSKESLMVVPKGNYAIRCDDIVVIDVDNKPENSEKASLDMDDMAERVFECSTFVVKSKSGNPHAYFLLDERMRHWKRRIGLYGFVDVLMGNKSLVIGPGSVVDGKQYIVYNEHEVAKMPNWLFKQIDSQMQKLQKHEKTQQPEEVQEITETEEEILEALEAAEYESPRIERNTYGGYDVLFGYKHTCPITEHEHDHIDGFVFKASNGSLLAGCYSHQCKGQYKVIKSNGCCEGVDKLIDKAAGTCGAHYDVACVVKELLGHQIKHIEDKIWYVWNPDTGIWKEDKGGKHIRIELSTTVCSAFAKRIIYWNDQSRKDEEHREAFEDRARRILHICEKLKDNYYKNSVVRECETLLGDPSFLELLDENTNVIGFNNGVYDFTIKQFRKGRPDDYVTMTVGYDFPHTVAPKALRDVKEVIAAPFDSQDMAMYITQVIASCLDGRRKFQEYYIWTGRGSNGKSTIQELIMQTLGDYAKPLDIAFWTKAKRECGGAMPELADKKGVRFVFSNEPEASDRIQVSKIKEVTGGERITARKLYSQPVTYRPQFGIFILCNDLPDLSKTDGGIERRTRVIPFKHQFKQHPMAGQRKADPMVLESCRDNLEWHKACMRLLLDAYEQVRHLSTLTLPNEVIEASKQYMEDNNPVGMWLKEHYEVTYDENDLVSAESLYVKYKLIDRTISKTAFGKCVTETNNIHKRVMKLDGIAKLCYLGIKKLNDTETED